MAGVVVVSIFCLWEWKGAKLPIVPSASYEILLHFVQMMTSILSVYFQARNRFGCVYNDVRQVRSLPFDITLYNSLLL